MSWREHIVPAGRSRRRDVAGPTQDVCDAPAGAKRPVAAIAWFYTGPRKEIPEEPRLWALDGPDVLPSSPEQTPGVPVAAELPPEGQSCSGGTACRGPFQATLEHVERPHEATRHLALFLARALTEVSDTRVRTAPGALPVSFVSDQLGRLSGMEGLEPSTAGLTVQCSTNELHRGARHGDRTRDLRINVRRSHHLS